MAAVSDAVARAWPILTSLPRAREDRKGGYYVSCPTDHHLRGDRSAGLHVSMAEDGVVLVKCFAGCDVREVLAAVGLRVRDLFPDTPERREAHRIAARAVLAPPDPHLVAIRNAEYEAARAGWRDAAREVSEAVVDSVARQRREEVVL